MGRSIALLSNHKISPDDLAEVMNYLGAKRNRFGWELRKEASKVFVALASDDLNVLPEEIYRDVIRELGSKPRSMIAVMFADASKDRLEWRMARAVGLAMAELWPIVWYDYANPPEVIEPIADI